MESAASGRAGRLAALLAPPVVYALIAVHYFGHFLAHPTRGVPGGADGVLYAWYFEWIEQSITHLHSPLASTYLNAPAGLNLMWNTALPLLAVLCIPLTATAGPIAAVGFLMVLAPVASASTCYFVLRRLTGRWTVSALVSTLYGFGPFFVGQQGHLHLTVAVFPPLVLLFGHRLLIEQERPALRTGVWLGIWTGLQMLVAEEMVVLTAVVALFAVGLLALLHRGEVAARRGYVLVGLGGAAVSALVIAAGPLAYQFLGPNALTHGIGFKGQHLDLAGLVRPSALQYFATRGDIAANAAFHANSVENTGYLGWPLLVLVLGVAGWSVLRHDRFGVWWLGTVAFTVLVGMGTVVHVQNVAISPGPWLGLRYVPLLEGVVVPRFSLLTTLLIVLLLGRWLTALRGRALALGTAAVVVSAAVLLPAGRYDEILSIPVPRFFATSAVRTIPQGATTFVLPYGATPDRRARVMFWQVRTHLRFRLIGGYSVFDRNNELSYAAYLPTYATLLTRVGETGVAAAPAEIAAAQDSVRTSGTDEIVVTALQRHAGLVTHTARLLTGCTPRHVADVTVCTVPRG